jgi:peroxygenase
VLQAHVAYFDDNKDGWISPAESARGFHRVGFAWPLALIAAMVIHSSFALWTTAESWWPTLSIPIARIHRAKHGSDTGSYDHEGRFSPAAFDAAFTRFGGEGGTMTWKQVRAMLSANANVKDVFGWTAAFLEWAALYWISATRPGGPGTPWVLTRERARQCIDGTLWPVLEAEYKAKRAGAAASKRGRTASGVESPQILVVVAVMGGD